MTFKEFLEDAGPVDGMAPPGNRSDSSAKRGVRNAAGIRDPLVATDQPGGVSSPIKTPEAVFGLPEKINKKKLPSPS